MRCLIQNSSLHQLHAILKPQQQHQHTPHNSTKSSWLSTTDEFSSMSAPKFQHFASVRTLKTKALPLSIVVVAATAPPKSGDISAFLPVSAVLLSMYFIANFMVPELITKYFGFDNLEKDQKVDDVNAGED